MVDRKDVWVARLKSSSGKRTEFVVDESFGLDYKQKLTAFLRITVQLVDRFEQLAPDVDGNTDPADVRLIKAFRTKLDELIFPQGAKSVRRFRGKR